MKLIAGVFLLAALVQTVAAPAAAQVEVGDNDFHISFFLFYYPDFDASQADVVYNSTEHEYLVVYEASSAVENVCGLGLLPIRVIFAQRIDAATGALILNNVSVSQDCDHLRDAKTPAVVYNPTENEYLVVWTGDELRDGEVDGELDIFGQLLSADLVSVGNEVFRISDMGDPGDDFLYGREPAVTHNSVENEYLVVWYGKDDVGGLVRGEFEIFGQRLNENGTAQGVNDFRISDMGTAGNLSFSGREPAVTYNSVENEYLVVWYGDDDVGGLVDNEREIFGQLLDATGAEQGVNDFRISDMGGTGDNTFDAFSPAVTFNPVENEYLVAWEGDDDVGGLTEDDFQIFGQRLGMALFDDGFESGDVSAWDSSQ